MGVSYTIPSIFTAVDRFSAPIRGMSNAVQNFVTKSTVGLAYVDRGFRKLLSPIASVGRMLNGLGFYVGLFTLVRLLTGAVDTIAGFQQANANLATVMETTVSQNRALALSARAVGLEYGKSATEVVKMQHELATLGFGKESILKMSAPMMSGSVALDTTPQRLAETVGAVIKSFDSFTDNDTQKILDIMTSATNKTALTFDKLATTLPIVNSPANVLKYTFAEINALLGILADNGVHVATSATALKNIFIDSNKRGHSYVEMLENITKHADKLTYAYNKFGKRSVVSALILSNELKRAKSLAEELENTTPGLTNQIAKDRLNTFTGSVALAKAAYQEFILAIEDGTGKYAAAAQRLAQVAGAMFLLSSDSNAARSALSKMNSDVVHTAYEWLGWLKLIGKVIALFIAFKVALIAWRVVVYAAAIATGVLNAGLGIMGALSGVASVSIGRSAVALGAYKVTAWLAAAATGAFNAALALGVGTLLTIAGVILFVVGLIAIIITKWNEWGAAVSAFLGPLGYVISLFQSFRRNWDLIVASFKSDGIVGAIKAIGRTMYDAMLMPIQQVYQLLSNLPGRIGESSAKMAQLIEAYRGQLGVNVETDESGNAVKKVSAEGARQDSLNESIKTTMSKVQVDFINVPAGARVSGDKEVVGSIVPVLGSTMSGGAQTSW
jgi:hypothetical protein